MRLTALILDDEAQSRSALRAKLELFCLEVNDIREASTVDEAWDLLIDVQPDIVFLDIHLGGEVGFALLDRINVDEPQWQGSVIFVTAHEAYALRAIKFSALDYLLKPVDPEELVKSSCERLNSTVRAIKAACQFCNRTWHQRTRKW